MLRGWHGPSANWKDGTCAAKTTSDCVHFHGGHVPLYMRPRKHTGLMMTALREPVSRLVSGYNDMHSMLSDNRTCKGRPTDIQYCGLAFADACQPGTGWNLHSEWVQQGRSSSPCIPNRTFFQWATQSHLSLASEGKAGYRDTACYMLGCPFSVEQMLRDDRKAVMERLAAYLRSRFLLVADATRDSVADFIKRMHYVLATPYDPTLLLAQEQASREQAHLDPRHNPTSSGSLSVPFDATTLTQQERAELLSNPHMRLESLVHQAAVAVDNEQRRCFARLTAGIRG